MEQKLKTLFINCGALILFSFVTRYCTRTTLISKNLHSPRQVPLTRTKGMQDRRLIDYKDHGPMVDRRQPYR